jgi:hypothetical protein
MNRTPTKRAAIHHLFSSDDLLILYAKKTFP